MHCDEDPLPETHIISPEHTGLARKRERMFGNYCQMSMAHWNAGYMLVMTEYHCACMDNALRC